MSGRWATQATRAMRIDGFTGRTTELIELSDLLSHADTRIVLVQGMGGMGKTWLARKYVESTDGVYAQQAWCSLVHDPDPANCVRQLLSQLQAAPDPSLDVYALVDVLAERLTTRTLIVLDNFETVLTEAAQEPRLLEGFDELFWMIDAHPQARLLVTSREAPLLLNEIGEPHALRLRLGGLDTASAGELLAMRGVSADGVALRRLIDTYDGNPQLLRLSAASIAALGGDVGAYLDSHSPSSLDEAELFDWHVSRVPDDELTVLHWLCVLREPHSLGQIQSLTWPRPRGASAADLMRRLRSRDLVQWVGQDLMTLQPAMLAFLTARLSSQVHAGVGALMAGRLGEIGVLDTHALMLGSSPPHVAARNRTELLGPLLDELTSEVSTTGHLVERLTGGLKHLQQAESGSSGYAATNVIALLTAVGAPLTGVDLSGLTFRHWDVSQARLIDVDLSGSDLVGCRFAFNFANVLTVTGHHARGLMACAGTDGAVWIWDEQGMNRGRLTGHTNWIRSAAFSPEGSQLATASSDGTLRLWAPDALSALQVVDVSRKRIWAVAWASADHVVVGDDTGTLSLVEASSGQVLCGVSAHRGRLNALCPAGDLVITGGVDGRVTVRSGSTLSQLATVAVDAPVTGVAFDERLGVAVAATTDALWVFDIVEGGVVGVRQFDTPDPTTCVTTVSGQRVACVGDAGGGLTWMDIDTGRATLRLRGHDAAVTALTQVGTRLLSGGEDQTLRQWEVDTGVLVGVIRGGVNHAWSVAVLDDALIASAHEDHCVRIWVKDPNRAWLEQRVLQGHSNRVWSVRPVREGTRAITGSEDTTARLWDVASGRCLRVFGEHDGPVWAADVSPDGEIAVTVGDEGVVRAWSVQDGRLLWRESIGAVRIRAVVCARVAGWVAAGAEDNDIHVFDLATGSPSVVLSGHTDRVNALALIDGDRLVSGSRDGSVRMWDVSTGGCVAEFRPPAGSGYVWAAGAHVGRDWVAAGCEDGSIVVWRMGTGAQVWHHPFFTARVKWISADTDGHRLFACGEDGQIAEIDLASGMDLGRMGSPRTYEGTRITGVGGVDAATREVLLELGAVECVATDARAATATAQAVPDAVAMVSTGGTAPSGTVFISYARDDSSSVTPIVEELRRRGWSVFFDVETLEYGARFETVIRDAIRSSRAMLLMMSPRSEQSRWVTRERLLAEECGVPILPLLLDGACFFGLQDLHYEDIRESRWPTERFFESLQRVAGSQKFRSRPAPEHDLPV